MKMRNKLTGFEVEVPEVDSACDSTQTRRHRLADVAFTAILKASPFVDQEHVAIRCYGLADAMIARGRPRLGDRDDGGCTGHVAHDGGVLYEGLTP